MSDSEPEAIKAINNRNTTHNTAYDVTESTSDSHKQDEPTPSSDDCCAKEVCDGADAGNEAINSDDCDSECFHLDSILPIAETLTSIMRYDPTKAPNDRSYYFDGVPTAKDMTNFGTYVKSIQAFTLTTATLRGFSFGALLRLSTMRNWQGAFFPSLKSLRVVNCDFSTMQMLNLFFSPSLESLEVIIGDNWNDECEEAHDIFLSTLSGEAPNLTCLKIRSTEPAARVLVSPFAPRYRPFEHLCTLHLEDVVIHEWPLLEVLGELEPLEDLSLTIVLRRYYLVRYPTNIDDSEWDILSDCLPDEDTIFFGFPRLKRLRIAARIELLRDFLGYIESDHLSDLAITLLASSKEGQTLDSLRGRTIYEKSGPPSDEEIIATVRTGRLRITFRNEDEFFCTLLERAAEKWHGLQSVVIDHQQPPTTSQRLHVMSAGAVEKLLLHPQLQRLEIRDWVTDFDIGELLASRPSTHKSNLQTLHLPTNASSYPTTEGLPWLALSIINKKLPKLTSFHGYFNRYISEIPDYTAALPDDISPNCNVETLALGDGTITWDDDVDSDYLLRVGIYLYSLFPHLKDLVAQADDESPTDWEYLNRLVKMCQASGRITRHIQA